jgi:hypothetical protein
LKILLLDARDIAPPFPPMATDVARKSLRDIATGVAMFGLLSFPAHLSQYYHESCRPTA